MSDSTIGRALRTRRAQLGLDQRDAAARIGMSRTTYSSYERDTQRPSVDVLPAIAGFLEVSIDDVLVLFGASAIAAARTALGRLSLGETDHAVMSVASNDADASDDEPVSSHVENNVVPSRVEVASRVFDTPDPMPVNHVSGGGRDSDVPDSSPYRPAVSIDVADEPRAKVHDEREKGKKKKKKKGKREKLVNPAFASHV